MRIYLMRHGKAALAVPPIDNFHRRLTPTGRMETQVMAKHFSHWLKEKNLGLYVSPLVRTQETAEILAEELRAQDIQVHSATLYPLAKNDWQPIANHLQDVAISQAMTQVCMVSHQPFLEKWLYELTGTTLKFRQSGVAIIDYQPAKSRLLAYMTPDVWGV